MNTSSTLSDSFSREFWMICFASFLFFLSFNMILAELPDYLTKLGGENYKGYIIGLFTISAGCLRPISGKLTDRIGRVPMMLLGAAVSAVCNFSYVFFVFVAGFLMLRFLHGISAGLCPTGATAYISDIVPAHRRGEAMGWMGLSGNIGMALGPPIGIWICQVSNTDLMFMISSAAAIISIFLFAKMPETLPNPQKFSVEHITINKNEIVEKSVWAPSLVMFCCMFAFGVMLTVIPDFSKKLGMVNKGLFFTVYTGVSFGVRFIAGKLSDIYGRVIILRVGLVLLTLAMLYLSTATSSTEILFAACIYGLSVGIYAPTVLAWAIDYSTDQNRGKAIATVYIAMEFSIGSGAFLAGYIYNNNFNNIPTTILMSAGVAAFATIFLFLRKK